MILHKIIYVMNSRQKALAILVLAMSFIASLLETIGVSAIVPLVNVLLNPTEIRENIIIKNIPFLQNAGYGTVVFAVGLLVILLYIIKNIYFILLSWVRIKYSCKIQRELSVKMLNSYMRRGYQFFLNKNMGELNRGVMSDAVAVYTVIYSGFRLLSELLTIMLICIYMCFADWQLAISVLLMASICLIIINQVFRKNLYDAGTNYRDYCAKANQALLQTLYGIKEVLVMHKQKYFVQKYEENWSNMQKAQIKRTVGEESPAYIIEGVCVSGLLLTVCVKAVSMENTIGFVAVLASFAIGAFRILPSLGKISSALNSVTTSLPSVDAVYENIKEAEKYEKDTLDLKNTNESFEANGRLWFDKNLEIRNIKFSYNAQSDIILNHINLNIRKGQSLAFIGQSGAGKSTLADIILGLLWPQEGGIFMDGVNIHDIPSEWAGIVGYVPQSVYLSDASIKENIAFGEKTDHIDEKKIWEAIEKSKLSEFVNTLPDGIETFVGDRGIRLSGGQRQRIAIARALYHSPEIMILDEATSALDNDTEKAVMEAIDSLQGKMTLIIIAHRLTTVRNCDVIYEVADGNVIERKKEEIL